MEFELEGGSFEATGNIEVTLPDYMVLLPAEELTEARRAIQADQMVIAAGRRPDSDEIVLMTADNRLLVLDGAAHELPKGRAFPTDFGHTIAIDNDEFVRGYFEVAADWAIDNATPIDVALLA